MDTTDNKNISKLYLDTIKDHLYKLNDDILIDDIDILCKYMILRFLKTSPKVNEAVSEEYIVNELNLFVKKIFPIVTTFVCMVNSSPLENSVQA